MEASLQRKIRWGGGAAVLAVVVAIAIYLVGYAPQAANNRYVIPARRYWYEKILEKIFLPHQLPYVVMVREAGERNAGTEHEYPVYGYTMMGRWVGMDYANDTMTLRDKEGREWKWQYYTQPMRKDNSYHLLMYSEVTLGREKQEEAKVRYLVINKGKPEETIPYFQEGDVVAVYWNEERTLAQILQDNQNPGTVTKLRNSGLVSIARIMAKQDL